MSLLRSLGSFPGTLLQRWKPYGLGSVLSSWWDRHLTPSPSPHCWEAVRRGRRYGARRNFIAPPQGGCAAAGLPDTAAVQWSIKIILRGGKVIVTIHTLPMNRTLTSPRPNGFPSPPRVSCPAKLPLPMNGHPHLTPTLSPPSEGAEREKISALAGSGVQSAKVSFGEFSAHCREAVRSGWRYGARGNSIALPRGGCAAAGLPDTAAVLGKLRCSQARRGAAARVIRAPSKEFGRPCGA